METAGLLNIPKATWYREIYLLFWIPPNGESMAQVCLRIDRVIQTLHRECSDKNVIIVCHGEIMWGFRIRLERMSQGVYNELDMSKLSHDRIHNCQIVQYTRRDPFSRELASSLNWRRSVCPWDKTLSSNIWERVIRPKFSTNDLLHAVNKVQRIV